MGDVPEEWASRHINVQEAYMLLETLKLFCKLKPRQVAGTRTVVDVDDKTLYYSFKKGNARNSMMYAIISQLFWPQVCCAR